MPSFSQEASKHHKGTPQYLRKISKSLTGYLIFQECFEFDLPITPQYLRQRHIFSREYLIFQCAFAFNKTAIFEVVLARTHPVPRIPFLQNSSQWLLLF